MITRREAAIISVYTGIALGELDDFIKYAEEKLGHKLLSDEIPVVWGRLKQLAAADFIALEIEK
jgi:hypothetical protein